MNVLSEKAKQIAAAAHDGQFYGTGDPYIYHLTQVADMAMKMGYGDEVIAACYLHDIIEDTMVSTEDLAKDFPESVIDAVVSVTYVGNDYDEKIRQAMSNPIGHVVKFCDSSCNYANLCIYGPRPDTAYEEVVLRRAGYISKMLDTLPTPTDISKLLS